jgi:ATP/maltotriose-dependent transcriptional regulator MalT
VLVIAVVASWSPGPAAAGRVSDPAEQVLAQVARGLSNVDIGRELHISEATVKTHLVRIFEKLGVSDRTAAVTKAIGQGLLPSP